jgi:hypothetical protein
MSAEIIQLRDFQNPKDIERMQRELEKEAAKILAETVPYGGKGIDGMVFVETTGFTAPDKDSA